MTPGIDVSWWSQAWAARTAERFHNRPKIGGVPQTGPGDALGDGPPHDLAGLPHVSRVVSLL